MSTSSAESISALLGRLYEAAADPQFWPEFLSHVIREIGAERGALVHHQLNAGDPDRTRQSSQLFHVGYSPEAVQLYNDVYGVDDPYARGFRLGNLHLRVGLCDDLVDHAALRRTSFYNEYARRFEVFYLCWIAIVDPCQHIALSLGRSERQPAFEPEQLKVMAVLAPHVKRALSMNQKIGSLQIQSAVQKRTVEAFKLAVVALSGKGHVVAMSARAEQLLREESGLHLKDRRIFIDDLPANARLQALVESAAQTAAGKGMNCPVLTSEPQRNGRSRIEVPTAPSGGAVLVTRDKEPRALQLIVHPFRSETILQDNKPCVLVFLSEPTPVLTGLGGMLRELYGLTRAEAHLASLVAAAVPLQEAACRLRIRESTARDRLKQIFHKTGASRQAELVWLLSRLPESGPK